MHLNDLAEILYQAWSDHVRPDTQRRVAWLDLSREQKRAWFEAATQVDYTLEVERSRPASFHY